MNVSFYDREGEPLGRNLIEAAQAFERLMRDQEYRRLAADTIGRYWISTVWIGFDMNYTGQGLPIIFETMVFDMSTESETSLGDAVEQLRYATEEQARWGHEEMLTLIRATADVEVGDG